MTTTARNYLDWGLVYEFCGFLGRPITGRCADHTDLEFVKSHGFSPYTDNTGWSRETVAAENYALHAANA